MDYIIYLNCRLVLVIFCSNHLIFQVSFIGVILSFILLFLTFLAFFERPVLVC